MDPLGHFWFVNRRFGELTIPWHLVFRVQRVLSGSTRETTTTTTTREKTDDGDVDVDGE